MPITVDPAAVVWTTQTADGVRTAFGSGVIQAGDALRRLADGTVARASNSSAELARVVGIALNSIEVAGQPVSFVSEGVVTISGVTAINVVGAPIVLGANGQLIEFNFVDLSDGDYITLIGLAASNSSIRLTIVPSGITYLGVS